MRDAWDRAVGWLAHRWRWARLLPAAVVGIAFLVLIGRNADVPALPDYEVPEGFTPAPAPTTAAPGAVAAALPVVDGTTTSLVPPNVGRARVFGTVTGPGGVVSGAVVRLERVVGGVTQVVDVGTTPEGFFDAAGIGGGRYRVRAFLAPTLAQASGEVLFLRHDEERRLDLRVEAFAEPSISIAVAPDPPLLGDPVNLGVRVTGRLVDADGFVRTQPLAGGTVQVSVTGGGWTFPSPSAATTDGDGQARFSSSCASTSPTRLFVTLRLPAALPGDPPTTAAFDLPTCVDPATLTTTTTSTVPASSSSSSPSSSTSTTVR